MQAEPRAEGPGSPHSAPLPRLANAIDFPPFRMLPHEDDTTHRHYLAEVDGAVLCLRHWCLLGDIAEVSAFIRPVVMAKDREGCLFRLHAYITERSSTLRLEDMVPGHTLAVMCPELHNFMDGTVGIRQENPDTAYIFRARLDCLTAEAERVTAGPHCFHCGGATMKKCLKCGVAHYCTKECQRKHWHAVHKGLCAQMVVLQNLVQLDFSRPPQGHLADFCELASRKARATGAGAHPRHTCHLPRPCLCGFQDRDVGNTDDCPVPGLQNHLDFPAAWCLPQVGGVSEQFYYDAGGAPSRHWAVVAEVTSVSAAEVKAMTSFGEELCVISDTAWDTSLLKRGHCIVGFYATLGGANNDTAVVSVKKRHILHFQTRCGLEGLFNAEAQIIQDIAEGFATAMPGVSVFPIQPIVRAGIEGFSDLPAQAASLLKSLVDLGVFGVLRQREGPEGVGSMWDEGHVRSSGSTRARGVQELLRAMAAAARDASGPAGSTDTASPTVPVPSLAEQHGRGGEPLAKANADLRALLADHPAGLTGAHLPRAYEARHGRCLEPKALGFKTWRRLLEACPDIEVRVEAGKDMWVQLKARDALRCPGTTPQAPMASNPAESLAVALPPTPTQTRQLGKERMRPSSIFFTHDSVKSKFKDGRPVRETLQQLRDRKIEPSAIPLMQVCRHAVAALGYDSRFWTFTGNRRLWVFRQLEEEGLVEDIEVQVVDKTVLYFRMTTKNGGVSVRVRGE